MHKLAAPEMKLKTFKEPLLELRYKNRVHTKNPQFFKDFSSGRSAFCTLSVGFLGFLCVPFY